jgi:hypothetical protein
MSAQPVAGLLLIAVPVTFNVLFFALGRLFDYPAILRRPVAEILERFAAGGTRLVLVWWAFALTAVTFAPVAVLVSSIVPGPHSRELAAVAAGVGLLAAIVQAIGLVRWPFLVPALARRYLAAAPGSADRAAVEVVFDAIHRLLGVAIGEHLGYLLTGGWTLLIGWAILADSALPPWLGLLALPIGIALWIGALEFVGPWERDGWSPAGAISAIGYLAWSAWLAVMGLLLIIG